MRRKKASIIFLLPWLGLAACGPDTCAITDEACILSHIEFLQNGSAVELVQVPEWVFASLSPDGGTGSKSDGGNTNGYLGCFIDADDHDLTGSWTANGHMTIESCAATCRGQSFAYYALEGADNCYCGQSYGRYGKAPAGDCYMPCSGNTNEICGGYLRSNVYQVIQPNTSTGSTAVSVTCPTNFPVFCGSFCCPADHAVCCSGSTGNTCGATDCSSGTTVSTTTQCPTSVPNNCSNGYCCDSGHPTCCPAAICSSTSSCDQSEPDNLFPAILSAPGALSFTSDVPEQSFPVAWTDPTGCQPAFCMSMRSNLETFSKRICTKQVRDGRTSGVWSSVMKVTYEPAETQTTSMDVYPITFCQGDPLAILNDFASTHQAGDPIPVGEGMPVGGVGITVGVTVTPPASSGPPGGWSAYQCSDYMTCTACSIGACVSVTSSGSCIAGYRTTPGNGWYQCSSCSNCTAAATNVTQACCPTTN